MRSCRPKHVVSYEWQTVLFYQGKEKVRKEKTCRKKPEIKKDDRKRERETRQLMQE